MQGIASAVETAPEWLATAKSTDWVGSLKPWTQFAGFGESLPVRLPSPGSLAARVTTNFALFLPNYVIVTLAVCLLTALTHPLATIVVAVAAFMGYKLSDYAARTSLRVQVAGRTLGPAHVSGLVSASLFVCVVLTFGMIVFTFVGVATTLVMAHAVLRAVPGAAEALSRSADQRKHGQSLEAAEAGDGAGVAPAQPGDTPMLAPHSGDGANRARARRAEVAP